MNRFDLHMHSCYSSDGQFTPKELIEIAKGKGLKTIALSDHDCISGVKEMIRLGNEVGIEVIPAIECSTSIGYTDVHLLGYGIDLDNDYFQNLLEKTQVKSRNAFSTRCDKLRAKYGVEIDEEAILKEANGKNPWFVMCTHMFNDPRYQDIPDFKDYILAVKEVIRLLLISFGINVNMDRTCLYMYLCLILSNRFKRFMRLVDSLLLHILLQRFIKTMRC